MLQKREQPSLHVPDKHSPHDSEGSLQVSKNFPSESSAAASAKETPAYPLRLQKFLARAGVASRRGSEDLMSAGRVTVNGEVANELGRKVDPSTDVVAVDGRVVNLGGQPVYLILHKPKGVLTTMADPFGRPTVAQLVPAQKHPGLFPVGRLDQDTTGLLLFTTNGELAQQLLHPCREKEKTYVARVKGAVSNKDLRALEDGIELGDGLTAPARAHLLDAATPYEERWLQRVGEPKKGESVVVLSIHEGKKHQVKRMLAALNHPVVALFRPRFATLDIGDLAEGAWRYLTEEEISTLRRLANQ